jgi:Predicted membrane protein
MGTFHSDLSNKEFPISERISGKFVRKAILDLIQKDYPQFTSDKYLSLSELNIYREKHIEGTITKQVGKLTDLEKTVIDSLKEKTTLTDKLDNEEKQVLTFGQRVADHVASFGGSWTFIISFGFFLFLWISINAFWLVNKGFDPYPFILLNLILSTIAALQAPVIMMSQNRQEEKDRERAKKDYMVNLKSELEIRMLHEKIDHLIINEQQEVLDIHKAQVDMLNDILKRIEKL